MNAYLFTSISTITQDRPTRGSLRQTHALQTWDVCVSAIVIDESSDGAQRFFEKYIRRQPSDESPMQIDVRRIAGAQFVDRLFTESGTERLDWRQISDEAVAEVESTPVDSFEQGYWVDVNQVVPSGKLSPNIDTLRRDLPQDVSDLNWSADNQFLFVLSVLSPPPAPTLALENDESALAESQHEMVRESDADGSARSAVAPIPLYELFITYPAARDKEAAALIQARNSVVAAWLWRRYAAATRLAANEIRIDPLYEVIGMPEASGA